MYVASIESRFALRSGTARGRRRALAVAAAVFAGVGLAVQARLNGELGARVGDGVAASLATTALGLVVLLAVVPGLPAGRRGLRLVGSALRTGGLRWWHCCGGVSGALFVASQGISVGALGVAVFTVSIVGGTALGSLAADGWGLGPSGQHPVSPVRIGGALVCVAAVVIAGHDRLGGQGTLVFVALPLIAGIAVAVQSALNGRVGAAARSAWPATLVNFVVATLTLAIVLLIELVVRGAPSGSLPATPWLYAAGLIGIGVIAVAALVVRHVGVLVFGLASVAGQLLGALALDASTAGHQPSAATWIGAMLTLAAVVLVARARATPASAPR